MTKSDPPRSIYIPYRIIKEIDTSKSYNFNSKAMKKKRKNIDDDTSSSESNLNDY